MGKKVKKIKRYKHTNKSHKSWGGDVKNSIGVTVNNTVITSYSDRWLLGFSW